MERTVGIVERLTASRETSISERPIPVPGRGTHDDVATGDEDHPARGLAIGDDDTRAIEAYQFLESITTGVQGEPGSREAAAAARVQEASMRSWDSQRWEPVAAEE